jgi:hypothetical protein
LNNIFSRRENEMGNSLHNKIPLGRSSVLASRPVQAALLLTGALGVALIWMALRHLF